MTGGSMSPRTCSSRARAGRAVVVWCRSVCGVAVAGWDAGASGVAGALVFGHATPDAVCLGGGESVGSALSEYGAVLADLFGGALTSGAVVAAFTVGGEEQVGVGAAAGRAVLPVPVGGVAEVIRHSGMGRFRSGAEGQICRQGRSRGCGWRTWVCCRGMPGGSVWVGVASRETTTRRSFHPKVLCDMTPRHIAVSLLMPGRRQSGSGSDRPGSGTVIGAAPRPQGVSVQLMPGLDIGGTGTNPDDPHSVTSNEVVSGV